LNGEVGLKFDIDGTRVFGRSVVLLLR